MNYDTINGFLWPSEDRDCRSVVFYHVNDIDQVMPYVKDLSVCVQAGGNCGVFPKHLSKLFKTVYTFEPEPSNFHCLETNVTEDNVVKVNAALGCDPQPVHMFFEEHEIHNYGACRVKQGGTIACFRIDDLHLESCGMIYLDIEGAESLALMGGKETIERCKPTIVVEDKGLEVRFGFQDGHTRELLMDMGYSIKHQVANDKVFTC